MNRNNERVVAFLQSCRVMKKIDPIGALSASVTCMCIMMHVIGQRMEMDAIVGVVKMRSMKKRSPLGHLPDQRSPHIKTGTVEIRLQTCKL